jgi:hypothetical protein
VFTLTHTCFISRIRPDPKRYHQPDRGIRLRETPDGIHSVCRYKPAPLQAKIANIVPTSVTNPRVNCIANIRTDAEATHCVETSMPFAKLRGELAVRWSKTERKKEVTEGRGT